MTQLGVLRELLLLGLLALLLLDGLLPGSLAAAESSGWAAMVVGRTGSTWSSASGSTTVSPSGVMYSMAGARRRPPMRTPRSNR